MTYAEILGSEPKEVVRPGSIEEAAAIVTAAHESGKSIIPWGGGTAQSYGHLPARADVVLDLAGLNRIIAHEPGDLTITVEAGVTLTQIQKVLAKHNQFLPLDPPHTDRATVGGILATDASGPSRTGYGAARDWLIGLRVVDAQGRIIKGGGKVVKNVTGYDLPKLHVGALGTLGVIVEATFKVAPKPEASRTVVIRLKDERPGEFISAVYRQTTPMQAYLRYSGRVASDGFPEQYIVLVYAGLAEVVEHETSRVVEIAEQHMSRDNGYTLSVYTEDLAVVSDPPPALALQVGGPITEVFAQHTMLSALAGKSGGKVETFMGVGVSLMAWAEATEEAIAAVKNAQEILSNAGKEAANWWGLAAAPPEMRDEDAALWHPLPPALPLMRRLKETLDPKATLNPGRFIGGI